MKLFKISIKDVDMFTSSKLIREKGKEHFDSGKVRSLNFSNNIVTAVVKNPNKLKIREKEGVINVECDCSRDEQVCVNT